MDPSFFQKGLLLGFSIAAPVGPIGVLCIRRTLAEGWLYGFVSGLGAATADALYGCVAAFGLTAVSAFLVSQQTWLRLVGGLFLCYLGIRTMWAGRALSESTRPDSIHQAGNSGQDQRDPPLQPADPPRGEGRATRPRRAGAFASTFFLTLTNPLTILSFAAIFSGLGLVGTPGGGAGAITLVLGVFCGSAAWWLLLSGTASLLRERLTPTSLLWVNRLSGLLIFGFGVYALSGVKL